LLESAKRLLSIFSPSERRHIYLLLLSTTLLGVIEIAGITSIMPFIAVVVDPSIIETNSYLNSAYRSLEFTSQRSFLISLGALSFVLLVVSNGFATLDAWFTFRFCYLRRHDICRRLLGSYLARPYVWLLERSPSELYKILLEEVDRVIVGTLMAGVGLFSDIVSATLILAVLLWVDAWVTISTLLVLGTAYALLFLVLQPRIGRLGEEYSQLGTEIAQRTREALDGVKEIKVLRAESSFLRAFAAPHLRSSENSIRHNTLSLLPHQGLELVAFGGIIALTLFVLSRTDASSEALAVIALYAFAAYRLIPTLKEIFDGVDRIRYNAPALVLVCRDFLDAAAPPPEDQIVAPLPVQRGVRLEHVCFQYPSASVPTLTSIDLQLPAGQMTCLMGATGAGKSTLIDLMLGLLEPESGVIRVDGVELGEHNVRAWQATLGYVPQLIYLMDDSIEQNIAFGVPPDAIDRDRVRLAARAAQLDCFVENELSQGYQTRVGERGVRLSGGQRQRIGIARALYLDARVLVFDEATNALDLETEERILAHLLERERHRTIVFVSHRTSVARRADQVVVLERGRVMAQGKYRDLVSRPEVMGLLVD